MLSNTITTTDADSTTHDYDLVSREGMTSQRRETGVASCLGSLLSIMNIVDLNNQSKQNKHTVKLAWNYIDSEGVVHPNTVYTHIIRSKKTPDDDVKSKIIELNSITGVEATQDDLFIGGN